MYEPERVKIRGFEAVKEEHLRTFENRESVILPRRGTSKSAGYDFFLSEDIFLLPKETYFVWSDVKAYMQPDEVLEIYPRSSIAIKKGITIKNNVGVIDSDYFNNSSNDGNIAVCLYNFGNEAVGLLKNEAIAQGIFKKFLVSDNCNTDSERVGGIGSTTSKE